MTDSATRISFASGGACAGEGALSTLLLTRDCSQSIAFDLPSTLKRSEWFVPVSNSVPQPERAIAWVPALATRASRSNWSHMRATAPSARCCARREPVWPSSCRAATPSARFARRAGPGQRAQFGPLLRLTRGRRPRYPLSSPEAAFSCRQAVCLPSRCSFVGPRTIPPHERPDFVWRPVGGHG